MAGANRIHWPRRGSLQVWPRVRAKRQYPRIRSWAASSQLKIAGFIGFKAGMTHVSFRDNRATSPTKGMETAMPVTIIECPPLKIIGFRTYGRTPYGSKLSYDSSSKKLTLPATADEVTLVVQTAPKLTATGKKEADLLELGITGPAAGKIEHAKALVGKELKISEVFKDGQWLDVHSVTKGKGFQGTVKRFGVKIRQHKSEKTKRGIGTLGPWRPRHVSWKVPQSGKMGYHTRTEYNKLAVKIMSKPEDVNPKGGLLHYGLIKNECILVAGSVPGPMKREVILTDAIRPVKKEFVPEIIKVSVASKQ
ncbi:MAG: 50S ribosomal protein L3 [Nanoarchaeota archaeon]|nr:50S ribosomal protein L3 [Nanoarchaeota archaeon]